jgi:hypothetical protein
LASICRKTIGSKLISPIRLSITVCGELSFAVPPSTLASTVKLVVNCLPSLPRLNVRRTILSPRSRLTHALSAPPRIGSRGQASLPLIAEAIASRTEVLPSPLSPVS